MASALDTAAAAIMTRLNSQWGVTTPILWENRTDKAPATGSWIEPWILWSEAAVIQTKDGDQQLAGRVYINIFAPRGEGRGPIDRLADSVRDIFNATAAVAGVTFYASGAPVLVPQTKQGGRWIQISVSTQFLVEETVT